MYVGPISVSAFEVMNAALPIFSQWEDVAGLWWGRLLQAIEAAIRCRLDCANAATIPRQCRGNYQTAFVVTQ